MQTKSEAMNSAHGMYGTPWKEWLAALAASVTLLLTSSDIVWIDWTMQQPSYVIANTVLMIVGAIVGAVSADTFGRKTTLLVMLIFIIPRLVSCFMDTRFVTMCLLFFGSGAGCSVVPLYISEIAGPSNRGILTVLPMTIYFLNIFAVHISVGVFNLFVFLGIVKSVALIGSLFFAGIVLEVFPETPQYLYWTARAEEAARSQDFFRGIHHGETIKSNTVESPPMDAGTTTQVNNAPEQERCGRMSEMMKFENRKSLAMILILITLKWASGFRKNLMIVAAMSAKHQYTMIFVIALEMIFSACVMMTINFFQRKICLCFVIFMNFVAVLIGLTPIGYIYWVMYGSIFVQTLGQIVLLAVALSYVGTFFPTSIRSLASVITISFEVLIRNVFSKMDDHLPSALYFGHPLSPVPNYVIGMVLFVGLIVVMIFFPKAKRDSYAEIGDQIPESRG